MNEILIFTVKRCVRKQVDPSERKYVSFCEWLRFFFFWNY